MGSRVCVCAAVAWLVGNVAFAAPRAAEPVVLTELAAAGCRDGWRLGATTTYASCGYAGDRRRGEETARGFLDARGADLGLPRGSADLELVGVRHGLATTHVRFVQVVAGLPVFDGAVTVHLDRAGSVFRLHNSYRDAARSTSPQPRISREAAIALGLAAADKDAGGVASLRNVAKAELGWFPEGDGLRLAWQLLLPTAKPLADLETVVDAHDGRLLRQRDRMMRVTGSGLTFYPNPVQAQGSATGLSDANDASSPLLDGLRVAQDLEHLDDGTGLLKGRWADLSTLDSSTLTDVDADEEDRVYNYDRDDPRFEQVVIYHALTEIQKYLHALGFDDANPVPNGIRDFPTLANAHWYTTDNSFYSTLDDALHFGDGGIDDGEDIDIIAHEYGHALQHNQNGVFGVGDELRAMGEAFGDYLAATMYFALGDATYQEAHAACVGDWDAAAYSTETPPCLRRLDGDKMYPDDLVGQEHADGEIWSRALWDIRAALGGTVADQIILEHHYSVPAEATMTQAALELIAADAAINPAGGSLGANDGALREAFCARGILSDADCLPTPTLVFPAGGEVLTGGVEVDVVWTGASAEATHRVEVATACDSEPAFADDVEGAPLWAVAHVGGTNDWVVSTTAAHSPTHSWFGANGSLVTDLRLATTAAVEIPTNAVLGFWHSYNLEASGSISTRGYDGGVVEISTNSGTDWTDLGTAMTENGYTRTISPNFSNPLANRQAFSGNSGGWIRSTVDLAAYAGQAVLIRFRVGTDSSGGAAGWWVDDITIEPSIAWNEVGVSAAGASSFPWSVPSGPVEKACVRIRSEADGYAPTDWVTGASFRILGLLFSDDFESEGTGAWSDVVGGGL